MDYRNYLQQQITSHGGDFRRDLTKSVTHLVARSGHGQKYKFAILWNIKVVSLRWLEDSMDRGMILEESLYDPLLPAAEQGINAWNPVAPVQVEKRIKNKEAKSQRPRKLRRVTSVKLGDQNEGIWTDIVGQSTGLSRNETPDDPFAMSPKATSRSLPQETKSFASETTLAERRDSKAQETFGSALKAAEKPRGIWYQSKFFISGFTEKQVSYWDIWSFLLRSY